MAYNLGGYGNQLSIGDYNKALANSGSSYQIPQQPARQRMDIAGLSGRVYDELDRNPGLSAEELVSRTGAQRSDLQVALLLMQGQQQIALDAKRGRYSLAPR